MDLHNSANTRSSARSARAPWARCSRPTIPSSNRDVAIKTMSAAIGTDDELRKRFHREAQSAARLSHPNIITIYDFGEDQGKIYMAMELLEGDDLKDLIGRHTPMTLEQKLGLMEQICDGLAFAHAPGRRAPRPEAGQHPHPARRPDQDHGLRPGPAVVVRHDAGGHDHGHAQLHVAGAGARARRPTARSDVFSLGAVFYELLANRKPFEADSLHAVLFQVMQNEPEPLSNLVPDIPPALQAVVERAMQKDPNNRFRDAGEMREGLRPARAAMAQWTGATIAQPVDATIMGIFDPRRSRRRRTGPWPWSPGRGRPRVPSRPGSRARSRDARRRRCRPPLPRLPFRPRRRCRRGPSRPCPRRSRPAARPAVSPAPARRARLQPFRAPPCRSRRGPRPRLRMPAASSPAMELAPHGGRPPSRAARCSSCWPRPASTC